MLKTTSIISGKCDHISLKNVFINNKNYVFMLIIKNYHWRKSTNTCAKFYGAMTQHLYYSCDIYSNRDSKK